LSTCRGRRHIVAAARLQLVLLSVTMTIRAETIYTYRKKHPAVSAKLRKAAVVLTLTLTQRDPDLHQNII